ncbi:unnamed protein product [Agarophyton chilense]
MSSRDSSQPSSPKRRPHSEAAPLSGRWRIVGGWSSLRRPHPKRSAHAPAPSPSGVSGRRDSTMRRDTGVTEHLTSRHRISLFLRRGRTRDTDAAKSHSEDESEKPSGLFRRAQSHLVKSVGERPAGEGARYVQYAAELDDASVERLRLGGRTKTNLRFVKDDDSEQHSHQLIGEICLADFADAEDDFDFLDGQSIDVAFEPSSIGMPSRTSLKIDSGQLRWIGDEKEFAAFFAQVGLDELWEKEHQQWEEFLVGDEVFDEWRRCGEEHNLRCGMWTQVPEPDIRLLLREFEQSVRDSRAHGESAG